MSRRLHWTVLGIALLVGVGAGAAISIARSSGAPATPAVSPSPAMANPRLDPGTPISGVAPGFTLTDQFGKRVSLSSFRGKVVVLSFNDPECTTICPLTTTALVHAKELLGPAAAHVELLGVGANPEATQVKWVRAYSQAHGMMHEWRFLTGSLPELKRVWHAYHIEAAVINDEIDHTPATFVIDSRGRLSRLYITPMAYSSVHQLGYEMAQSLAALLPEHPALRAQSLAPISLLGPKKRLTLPSSGGAGIRLGPGSGPHLVLFFDTWAAEVTDLRAHLDALNRYQATAERKGLPPLVAIDEGGVERSPQALPSFLQSLPHPLSYPVAVDDSGRVADGYRVQDSPWLTLVSDSGRFLYYEDIAVKGWPTLPQLLTKVRAALTRPNA
ncbi:MAG TPA: SCO family protein [Gaiellaceae bacterium]|nr:SCO family protein [Gaiellaceae bacterium]